MNTNLKRRIARILLVCMLVSIFSVGISVTAFAGSWGFAGEGWYQLLPKCASSKCLDVSNASNEDGANIQIYDSNHTDAQWFYFASIGNGYYTIVAKCSGKVLDVKGASKKSGTNVQQWHDKFGDNQIWKVESAGNGYYYIRPANNESLALAVSGGSRKSGANVQVSTYQRNSSSQMWKIWCGNTKSAYSSISGIKATSTSTAVTYYVKANGTSKVTVRALNSPLIGRGHYKLEGASRFRVKIVADSGEVIYNKIVTGKSNTFSVKKSYGAYRVEITRYGNWADDWMWNPNLGYYCQISLTDAALKK